MHRQFCQSLFYEPLCSGALTHGRLLMHYNMICSILFPQWALGWDIMISVHFTETDWDWDWDKFIQHNMTLYRCLISDIHDSSYVLFRTNLISNTSLHVGRPLLRPCLVAYAEATLARQIDSATNEKFWHHFRILIVDKWSVVWNECKKSWVPNDRLEKPLIPCNMISN